MNPLSFIILQAADNGTSATVSIILRVLLVFGICAVIFILIRTILLWYWKVDVIVNNQAQQTMLIQQQTQLLERQNQILTELKAQMKSSS
jgi:uncharacterized membrane protein YjgN (DUF898 family)